MRRSPGIFVAMAMTGLMAVLICQAGTNGYALLTAGHGREVKPDYFGTHFHRLALSPGEKGPKTSWPETVVGSVRLWDSGVLWAEVAPKAGQWNFDRLDAYVTETRSHGASVLYTLGGTPRWASARPDEHCPYGFGCSAEPVRMAHWEEYVRRVAQRYRGRIGAYELWNEPYFSDFPQDRKSTSAFFTGSVANMVEMTRIARKVLDEEDPSAMLLSPGFVGSPDRLDMFLSSGGRQYVQAIACHFYSADADQFMQQIAGIRQVMEHNGVGQLPLWNTETGIEVEPPDTPFPLGAGHDTREQAAAKLAQFLVLGAAAGLERFYHYAWDNPKSGMIGSGGEELPNGEVMRKVRDWLLGSRLSECHKTSGKVTVCEGSKGPESFAILWAERELNYTLLIPKGRKLAGSELALGDPGPAIPRNGDRVLLRIGQVPQMLRFAAGAGT